MLGERIDNYRVLRKLGEGGMGAVYEALNEDIDRRVAIKVLHARFSEHAELSQRFLNEARAANIIGHPGIVSVSEAGQLPGGAPYIVMEMLQGESLRARLKRTRLPLEEVLRHCRQVASALTAAHARRIVHRDLKPDNVMLVPDPDMPGGERAKILDFGIAKLHEEQRRPGTTDFRTQTGTLMGTPDYMAPEQCRGAEQVDDRADVYALGVMLYEMIAGHVPFQAPVPQAVIAMQIYEQPPPLQQAAPGLPPALAALVMQMLRKEPAQRPSMAQVAELLGGYWQQTGGASASLPPMAEARPGEAEAWAPTLPPGSLPPSRSSVSLGPVQLSAPPGALSQGAARRRPAWLFAALALVTGGGGLLLAWPRRGPPAPVAVARPGTGTGPAAPQLVHCRLRSEPAGALVLSARDHVELGRTPWEGERTKDQGPWAVLLRHHGYEDQKVSLDPQSGCETDVVLRAEPAQREEAPGPADPPAARGTPRKKAGKKQHDDPPAPKEDKKYEPRPLD